MMYNFLTTLCAFGFKYCLGGLQDAHRLQWQLRRQEQELIAAQDEAQRKQAVQREMAMKREECQRQLLRDTARRWHSQGGDQLRLVSGLRAEQKLLRPVIHERRVPIV